MRSTYWLIGGFVLLLLAVSFVFKAELWVALGGAAAILAFFFGLSALLIIVGTAVYNAGAAPGAVLLILGIAAIVYALLTDYELGAVKLIPMRGP